MMAGLGQSGPKGLVHRRQLVDSVVRDGACCVCIAAPAGWGKTTLASQVAAALGQEVVWVSCDNRQRPAPRIVDMVAQTQAAGDGGARDSRDLSARRPIVVIDAVVCDDPAGLARLIQTSVQSQVWTAAVVTTRQEELLEAMRYSFCVGSELLRFSTSEMEVLVTESDIDLKRAAVTDLLDRSGGQPALASLLAREYEIRGRLHGRGESTTAHRLVMSLLSEVLDSDELRILHLAALMGRGTASDIEGVVGDQALSVLRRAAGVVPLVQLVDGRRGKSFEVHGIARDALLAAHIDKPSASDMERVADSLLLQGRHVDAGRMAQAVGQPTCAELVLRRAGSSLLNRGEAVLVRALIELVGDRAASAEPRVLYLMGCADLQLGNSADGARALDACIEVSAHEQDDNLVADCLLAQARAAYVAGDQGSCMRQLRRLAALSHVRQDANRVGLNIAFAAQAFACLMDGDELDALDLVQSEYVRRADVSSESAQQVRLSWAIARGLFHGDWRYTRVAAGRVRAHPGVSVSLRILATLNAAAAAAELGLVTESRGLAETALTESSSRGMLGDYFCLLGTLACLNAMDGDAQWFSVASEALEGGQQLGDVGSTAMNAIYCAGMARSLRDADHALQYVGRAESILLDQHLPVLSHLCAIERSTTLALAGDSHSASLALGQALTDSVVRRCRTTDARLALGLAATLPMADAAGLLGMQREYFHTGSCNWQVASHLRAFPRLLAPLTLAMGGPEAIPAHLLRMVHGRYATDALEASIGELDRDVVDALAQRMIGAPMPARIHPSADSPDPQPARPACTVRLLGAFEVRTATGPVAEKSWGKRKARVLFAMLATRHGKDIPRDQIIEALWPDMTEQAAMNNFYVVWSAMKRALSPGIGRDEHSPYVEHIGGICRIIPGSVECDLDLFDQEIADARRARSVGDTEAELAALRSAVERYRGDLLPGDTYDDWFAPLRERCRHDCADAMRRIAEILEERGQLSESLGVVRQAMLHDPWREDLYQAALRLQMATGQRSAAIETYLACRSRLVDDLGIDPSGETTRLYQQVLGMEGC